MKMKWVYPSIKGFSAEARTADFVFSTPDIDRHGEVVDSSWNLKFFKKNPVVLYGHNSSDLPIGRVTELQLNEGKLWGTIQFASELSNPKAEQVFRLVEEKILKAVSVGFFPGKVVVENRDGREVVVLKNNELVEVSVVPVGANRQALLRACKELGIDSEVLPMEENELEIEHEVLADDYDKLVVEYAELAKLKNAILVESTQLMEERNNLRVENKKLQKQLLVFEIDKQVGGFVGEAEKQILLKLHDTDKALFDEQLKAIKARPEVALFQRIVPAEPQSNAGRDFTSDDKGLAGVVRTAANAIAR